jgi:hypothetical protein
LDRQNGTDRYKPNASAVVVVLAISLFSHFSHPAAPLMRVVLGGAARRSFPIAAFSRRSRDQ